MTFDGSGLWRELAPLACVLARVGPVAFLCPALGGSMAPPTVRIALALALTAFIARALPPERLAAMTTAPQLVGTLLSESLLGLALGLAAAAPFDSARIGGRFVDLFRGSSAEAALPVAGTREAATGDLLYQVLLALVSTGGGLPLIVGGLIRSFARLPPGAARLSLLDVDAVVRFAGGVLASGLVLAAPVCACCLFVDLSLGLAARVAPSLGIAEQMVPTRLLVGAIALWLGLAATTDTLLGQVADAAAHLSTLSRGGTP